MEVPDNIPGEITASGFGTTEIIKTSSSTYEVKVDPKYVHPEKLKIQSEIDIFEKEFSTLSKQNKILREQKIFLRQSMKFLSVKKLVPIDSDDSDSEEIVEKGPSFKEMMNPEMLNSLIITCDHTMQLENKLDSDIQSLQTKIQEIRKKIDQLKVDLGKIKDKESKTFNKFSIAVNLVTSQKLEFEIYYMVSNCTWKPSYELHVNTLAKKKSLSLYYYANVMQDTKEDWKDIPIVLTSVDTALGVTAMKLDPLYVNFSSAPGGFMSTLFGSVLRKDDVIDTLPDEILSKKTKGVAICTFELDISNIPSDSLHHRVLLTKLDLDCDLTHYCIPGKDVNVYLQLLATNSSKYSLLKGPMDVFLDGGYVTLSELNDVNPSEHFDCFLGTDPTVKAKYFIPKRYSTSSGFFSTTVKTLVKRQISLTNTKQSDVKIMIKDQLPRSTNSSIKVNLVHPKMNGDKKTVDLIYNKQNVIAHLAENNNVEWMANIKGGVEICINFEYIVESPGGKVISINSQKSSEF